VDLRHPPFTNFTALLGDTTTEVIGRLVAEVDVRSAYALALLWLGLRGTVPNATRSVVTKVVATAAFVRVAGVIIASLFQ
jgi:hypothetical protein